MEYRYFKENLMIHRVENIEQLGRVYICKICRGYKKPNDLKNTTEFKAFQREIQEVIKEYIARNNILAFFLTFRLYVVNILDEKVGEVV
jgi:hypothetical protein